MLRARSARRYARRVTSTLIDAAGSLFTKVPEGLRIIGGFGVWLLAGHTGRLTKDFDVVAESAEVLAEASSVLQSSGYRLSPMLASWVRATSKDSPRIDLALHPVINPRSFEAMSLSHAFETIATEAGRVRVATRSDLVRLKLLAHRERDFVDILQLVAADVAAHEVVSRAENDDCERSLAEGCLLAASARARGDLERDYESMVGRPVTQRQLAAFDSLLQGIEKSSR